MIGTDIGNPYTQGGFRQGRGFATVLNNTIGDAIAKNRAEDDAKKAAAAKSMKEGQEMTEKNRPGEVWHVFSNDFNKEVEGKINEGAKIQTTMGITNMWADTSKESVDWRNGYAQLNQRKANIDQAKEYYDGSLAKYETNPNKYKPESVARIRAMADSGNYEAIAGGTYEIPRLEYKAPVTIMNDFFVKGVNGFQEKLKEGEVPKFGDVMDEVNLYFASPENEGNVEAAVQMYGALTEDQKRIYRNAAHRAGADPDKDAWKYYMGQNFYDRLSTKEFNLGGVITDIAAKAPTKSTQIEDLAGVTTTSERLSDANWPKSQASTYIKANPHLLYNDAVLSSLGIDPSKYDPAELEDVFIDKMADEIRRSVDTKYAVSRESGGTYGGLTEKEFNTSYSEWRRRIGLQDLQIADEAAKFITGAKFRGEMVVDAKVIPPPPSGDPFSQLIDSALLLDIKNKSVAKSTAKEYFDKAFAGFEPQNETEKAYYEHLKDQVEKEAESGRIFIPMRPSDEQVLKGVYQEGVTKRKSPYKPAIKDNLAPSWDKL